MQVYLVGGAVRDGLLSLPIKDKDFMVVGTDSSTMKSLGFIQVGADFPVFLHPKTHNEYALARTERKSGIGHLGFNIDTKGVSLADDLLRRDLTINAMAIQIKSLFDDTPITGAVIDPYGGLDDLKNRTLRHVSPAFSEDPLRVLRVARFYARFAPLGFSIATDTQALMKTISNQGELSHLSRERIWSETARALSEQAGFLYFGCLYELSILHILLPSLAQLWQNNHIYQTTQTAVQNACQAGADLSIRFALLLGGFTQDDKKAFDDVAYRLNIPKAIRQFALCFINYKDNLARLPQLNASELLLLIEQTKAHKDTTTLLNLLKACNYWYDSQYELTSFIQQAIDAYQRVSMADIDPTLTGQAIGQALHQQRLQALQVFLDNFTTFES